METKSDFEIGDLVFLKEQKKRKKTIRNKLFATETPEAIGIGIITEKLEELFILPDSMIEDYFDGMTVHDLARATEIRRKEKKPVQTSISKVYWMKLEKSRWEYEDDLEIYKIRS